MFIEIEKTGSIDRFADLLKNMSQQEEVKSILALACDGNGFSPATVDPILSQIHKPLFGGIFPEIIHGCNKLSLGTILVGLSEVATVKTVHGLSDSTYDFENSFNEECISDETHTLLVFVDGFSTRIADFIDTLFNMYGLDCNYIGGGAGSLSLEQKPCLFSNRGLLQDTAILAMLQMKSGVGVSHGWMDIEGPITVTESDRNIIKSLDWKPAFEVYQKVVEKHSGRQITAENFFDIAKSYPFGIYKLDSEKIVRDPLMVGENSSLVCVGEVPEGSFVHILTGNAQSLIGAAKHALELSEKSLPGTKGPKTTLFIDCISRALFLGDDFTRELEAVYRPASELIGALTIGEIANSGHDYLEFYNKTSVVGMLAEA